MTRVGHLGLISLCAALVPLRPGNAQELAHSTGMILGRGYESTTGQVLGDCINFTSIRYGRESGVLDEVRKDLKKVTNKHDLSQHLQVSAEGAYSFAGGTSVHAKAKFTQDQKMSSYSVNFVALVEVETSWDYTSLPSITSEAQALTANEFRSTCGDTFIAGLLSGGEFYGVGEYSTTNDSTTRAVEAAIDAHGVNWAASAAVEQSTKTADEKSKIKIELWKRGSSSTAPTAATLEGIAAETNTFEQSVGTSGGSPRMVWIQSYKIIPGGPPDGEITSLAYEDELEELNALDALYETLGEDVRYIVGNPSQFKPTTAAVLGGVTQAVQSARATIKAAAVQCLQTSGETCVKPTGLPAIDQLRTQLPVRYAGKCADRQRNINVTRLNAYSRTRGDDDISGHDPDLDLDAKLTKEQGRYIVLNLDLRFKEDESDWTTYKGEKRWTAFDLHDAPHCVFETNWATPTTGRINGSGGKDNHKFVLYDGSGSVVRGSCRSDTYGDDDGDLYCKDLKFNPINVYLEHEENIIQVNLTVVARMRRLLAESFLKSREQALKSNSDVRAHLAELAQADPSKAKVVQKIEPRSFRR
jgi:hypothetical protein